MKNIHFYNYLCDVSQKGDRLHSFTQAHFIGQNAVDAVGEETSQPSDALNRDKR